MTDFAGWVAPSATKLKQSREDIIAAANGVPDDAWEQPSGYEGWTFRDQLAHLGDSHESFHSVLGSVLAGEEVDFARFARIDDVNAENLAKRKGASVADVKRSFDQASARLRSC